MNSFMCGMWIMSMFAVPDSRFADMVSIAKYGDPTAVVVAYLESGFDADTKPSSAGAVGLMQVTKPAKLEVVRVQKQQIDSRCRNIPKGLNSSVKADNVLIGYCYLQAMKIRYKGNIELAVIDYNGGIRQVNNYRANRLMARETRNYHRKYKNIITKIEECKE